jgi:type IV pilus assembly protein PilA
METTSDYRTGGNVMAQRFAIGSNAPRHDLGFTLIELLVVIIIIGILAAIAIPAFLSQRDRAEQEAARSNVRNAATSQQAYYAQHGEYAATEAELRTAGFRQGEPAVTVTGGGDSFCVEADSGGQTYRQTQDDGSPRPGACPAG